MNFIKNLPTKRLVVNRHNFVTIQLAIILAVFSCATYVESFVLPGFQGYVLDKESGKPIENAYVVSFTDYYSLSQRLNAGGGNSYPDSLQIAITDKRGFFKMDSYRKYSGGWADSRDVYLFKEGYVYAVQCVQPSEKKNVLRIYSEIYGPSGEIPLSGSIKIYLSHKEAKNIDGSPVTNGYMGLLYRTRYYHDYFRKSDKALYKRLTPYFSYLYRIVNRYSEDIIKTFPEPNMAQQWEDELSRYRERLNLYLNKGGGGK